MLRGIERTIEPIHRIEHEQLGAPRLAVLATQLMVLPRITTAAAAAAIRRAGRRGL